MEKIIAYIDDAEYALQQLGPMAGPTQNVATEWVLVACPPRMTRRISKWVSHSARESWRQRWSEKLFAQIVPSLQSAGGTVTAVLAKDPLVELTRTLMARHGAARVLDARRPKFGQPMQPVAPGQQAEDGTSRWGVPGAVVGMGAVLVLAAE